ncbi:MAG: Yip1 family protein [Gaiella sp.]
MAGKPLKPAPAADAAAEARADEAQERARAWWRRVPLLVTRPRAVFTALAETDELDVDARSEPVLAITILAGMAALLLTPTWARLLDDPVIDRLVVAVLTFVGGLLYAAAGYFLLGLALWVGAKGVGVDAPFRLARQLVAFAAVPLALSLAVLLPAILLGFGSDWFRSGGSDEGVARDTVTAIGLAFAGWSLALVVIGLRTTFRLPWRGVVGALALAAVLLGAIVVLPGALPG